MKLRLNWKYNGKLEPYKYMEGKSDKIKCMVENAVAKETNGRLEISISFN